MWRGEEACLAEPWGAGCDQPSTWQMIGPDSALLQSLAQALARFGVAAAATDLSCALTASMPVLCDARSRGVVHSLLGQPPSRPAPILVFGANSCQLRARLILAGADDAVSARITPYELAARMQAALRAQATTQGIIHLAGFAFDTGLRRVCWQGTVVPLMPREFDLLLVLARNAGVAISRDMLLRKVWRTAFDPGTNSPEVHIFKLRQKLAGLGEAVRIETVKRQGYRLVSAP
ncbi:response regulator transcription factor [Blastomonas sp.]|uniref:winged helix-turn-helix transcriptional regulator n=1 Tax=Blastomonas sp. TaxID=1909299 RepID=UPI00262E7F59|nr:response regulator transcription factor [Blastomonas sp.]MDM7956537.1 response regulator transcription factor [Blastomonas sp.]